MADEAVNYVTYNDNMFVYLTKLETTMYDDILDMIEVENKKTVSTILYNNFSTEVDAYYFPSFATYTGSFCSIYRKTYLQTYFNYVCTLSNSAIFKDFNIHNHDFYEYLAVVSSQNDNGKYVYKVYENIDDYGEKIYSETNWGNWSICNIEETDNENIYSKVGNTWLLGLNLEEENLTQNLSVTKWDTLGQYPKISVGERNYLSSSVTCLLGRMAEVTTSNGKEYRYTERENLNSEYKEISPYIQKKEFTDSKYSREMEKFLKWRDFCGDGALKLLKDIKGNAWVVQIIDSPTSSYNTKALDTPTTISFDWAEVIKIDDISIIT